MSKTHADNLPAIRRARAYLLRVAEPPAPGLSAFIDAHGPRAAAHLVRNQDVPEVVWQETAARHHHDLVDTDLAAAKAVGARLVIPEDDEWPAEQFATLARVTTHGAGWATPPIALWTQSAAPLRAALDRAVAIVGARASSSYGSTVATEFGYGLAVNGTTVINGGSYGIDAEAHRGALSGDGTAVAVLPTGIDMHYPRGNHVLTTIRNSGVLLSEYPPGTPPSSHRFRDRHRLVTALSTGVVVVEAGQRSGALHLARITAAIGRPVMAVPGPITSAVSVGCNELLRSGIALPVTSIEDVQDAIDAAAARNL